MLNKPLRNWTKQLRGGFLITLRRYSGAAMLGGIIYTFIEILWRGYSHWSMTVLGGVCFAVLYLLYDKAGGAHMVLRCAAGSAFITAAEFLTGCIVNLRLGWNVWSYSSLRFNIFGQVSLLFSVLWFFLCILGFKVCAIYRKAADFIDKQIKQ